VSEYIQIYTDGSARGNPGPGGFGVILKYKQSLKEISQGYRLTTNNRMELLAVVCALESLKTNAIPVKIYSDSKYVIDSIQKGWIYNWHSKGFAKKKNKDLWLRYLSVAKSFKIEFVWVKGHNGHPENERCDVLAVQAALGGNLLIDQYFEEVQQHEN
jgi:ribonuclease HI